MCRAIVSHSTAYIARSNRSPQPAPVGITVLLRLRSALLLLDSCTALSAFPSRNRSHSDFRDDQCDDKRLSLQLKWRLCLKPCAKLPAVMMWEPPVGWSLNPLGIRTWEPESNRNTLGSLKMYALLPHRAKALVCTAGYTVPVLAA